MVTTRGQIKHRARAKQLRDYRGLRYGAVTPMDVDGFMEFADRLFVFFEFKSPGATLPRGQSLALQRLVRACEAAGKAAVCFVCEHSQHNPEDDIDAARATVVAMYTKGVWLRPRACPTLRWCVDYLRDTVLSPPPPASAVLPSLVV